MVRVEFKDLIKAMELLKVQSAGGPVSVSSDGAVLKIKATDKQSKELVIELSDVSYPMMPRLTKTETF